MPISSGRCGWKEIKCCRLLYNDIFPKEIAKFTSSKYLMPIRVAIKIFKRKTIVGEDGRNYNNSALLVGM